MAKISSDFLSQLLLKWGDNLWFKILSVILLVYFISIPILTPIISYKYQQENISQSISSTLDDRDANKNKQHKSDFESSRQAYALAKHTMAKFLPLVHAEYIFLLEFHNGSENVMTGVQFCRFDITLEIIDESVQYISLEKFKDDIVARYDILLSDELSTNKIMYYTKDEFTKIDRYLAQHMQYINAEEYALVSLKDKDGKIFGALMCVSNNDNSLNLLEIRELSMELQDIFVPKSHTNNQ